MRGIRAAVLSAAALLALSADTVVGVELRDRTCFEHHGAKAAKLLSGEHIRIGMYVSGDTNNCTGSVCEIYGEISRESNKKFRTTGSGNQVFQGFQAWTGYDIELIEELAERGNFNYTIVSMGGGPGNPVANTHLDGSACTDPCKAVAPGAAAVSRGTFRCLFVVFPPG